MLFPSNNLTTDNVDGVTRYHDTEINFVHGLLNSQLPGALLAAGFGVLLAPGDTSLQVTAGTGLSVNVAIGAANVNSATYGAVSIVVPTVFALTGLAADSTIYVFAGCIVNGTQDSRTDRQGVVFSGASPAVDGAVLLAQVTTGATGVTTIVDRRDKLSRLSFAGAYDAARIYDAQNLVTSGGQTWLAKRQSVGVTPVEGDDWTLFAGIGGAAAAIDAAKIADGTVSNAEFLALNGVTGVIQTQLDDKAPLSALDNISAGVYIGTEAPPSPAVGALWLDTDEPAPEALAAVQGSLTRETVSATTASLALNEADASTLIAIGRTFLAAQLATSGAAWVRLYKNAAYRTADSARVLADPEGGENGLMLDIVTTGANLEYDLSPLALLSGDESEMAMTVVNLGAAGAVTVTLSGIRLEN